MSPLYLAIHSPAFAPSAKKRPSPAPGICEGAICTRFGLVLVLWLARRCDCFRVDAGGWGGGERLLSAAIVVAALSCTRAAAVVLRVLYRLVIAVAVTFDVMLSVSAVAVAVIGESSSVIALAVVDAETPAIALAVVDAETSAIVETSALSSLLLKTAAAACSHIGTRAIAIPRIVFSAGAGMLRAVL